MAWAEFRITKSGVAKHFNEKTRRWEKGSWYAVGRDPETGARISEPAGSWDNFKNARKKVEAIESGQVKSEGQSARLGIVYNEYEIYMKKTKKPGTWSAYNWGLEKLLAFLTPDRKIKSIVKDDMIKFRAKVMPAHSINGLIDILKIARAFFSYCVECGYIQLNPASGITKGLDEQDVAVFLTDEQVRHLITCIDNPGVVEMKKNNAKSQGEFGDLIKTVLLTGMREGDICSFRNSFIRNDKIFIKGKGKGAGKTRMIPINSKLMPILEKYKDRDFVFEGWNERRIKSRWVRLYRRAKKSMATMPNRVRFHDLRHTFASNYLLGGGTLADLQIILGHSKITTTVRYAHFQESDLVAKMEKVKSDFLDALPPSFRVA